MCYWVGREQHKELDVFDASEEEFIRNVIIMFDTEDELFHGMMLPDSLYDRNEYFFGMRLLVWNQSIALFGVKTLGGGYVASIGIWVMDEFGSWTKHITFDPTDEPLAFWKSNEIVMNGRNGRILSYNPGTKKLNYLPIQSKWTKSVVVYVNSIVSVLGGNNLKSRDNSTPNTGFSLFKYFSLSFGHSMVEKKSHSYSVWAFPSDDMSLRIKKVMEGLRVEFGGSKIEPHITLIGSIRMTHEDVINKFRSLRSLVISSFEAKVNRVVTRSSYYQCVSLLIHSSNKVSLELSYAIGVCGGEFQFWNDVRPHLSLLYGYLTEEERKKAQERVSILDEAINSLSFPVTRLALYKIGYKDTSLRSWEKIAEYPLH
ncbi:hypothetical protein M0R45_028643 [Rubus argutus]|uniref:RNA ligase/cyclic nucleotide phosphodiesterase family protein n=1 Tax=Rubus argutus TaxID=59490 RepID=A0AAW1W7V4_RUBAR